MSRLSFILLLTACARDADGDGFASDVDCDDTRADVNPGARERAGNGVDDDCAPETCLQGGFVDAPERWSLPEGYGGGELEPFPMSNVFNPDCEDDPTLPYAALHDITGDGILDLVIPRTCDDAVPMTEWWVHVGTSSGYAADRTVWTLPPSYAVDDAPFDDAGGRATGRCEADRHVPSYGLFDLTGDGVADLVVTSSCDDPTIGQTAWRVHAGGAAGYAAEATRWALPSGYGGAGTTPFMLYNMNGSCDEDGPYWFVADVNADRVYDLVIVYMCGEPSSVGRTEWLVHDGGAAGFAEAARSWALPSSYVDAGSLGFPRVSSTNPVCEGDTVSYTWTSLFVDGDDYLDLVVTHDCSNPDVGDTRWLLHAGGPDGFAATAEDWSLPAEFGVDGATPFVSNYAPWCDPPTGTPGFLVTEWDGALEADLLVFATCTEPDQGWRLFPGGPGGFGAAVSLSRPDTVADGFGVVDSLASSQASCGSEPTQSAWEVLDLDGDGLYDLVVFDVCEDDELGVTHWMYYAGACDL
ncbi:MAG: putative metal-binding motif-containing protein [Pseudomonadota bacterium]|nr:putative metal-binding motif-containing protein [Pseudomonadota bacterium]